MIRNILGIVLMAFMFGSCSVNNNLMLKTDKDYQFEDLANLKQEEYKISPDDILTFQVFPKQGYRIIESSVGSSSGNNNGQNSRYRLEYVVKKNGVVELPLLDSLKLVNLTVPEAQDTLRILYSKYYHQPFVQLKVVNKRAIVFPGNGSDAKVVLLENNNTTLMEVLASAGGITKRGKAANIKLMRRVGGHRKIFQIDLSTIEGLQYTDLIIQANDYIYVEPVPEIAREILGDITPIISILSSIFVVLTIVRSTQ